jgi:hypothetical protein
MLHLEEESPPAGLRILLNILISENSCNTAVLQLAEVSAPVGLRILLNILISGNVVSGGANA